MSQNAASAGSDAAALDSIRPRLTAGLERQRRDDGRLLLVGGGHRQYMDISAAEAVLLDLLDGERSVRELLRGAGHKLTAPAVLQFMRRLWRAEMLEGVDDLAHALGEKGEPTRAERLASPATSILAVPGLALLLRPLVALGPLGASAILSALGLLSVGGLGMAISEGRLDRLFNPFLTLRAPLAFVALYLMAAVLLSARGLIRGLVARSHGIDIPGVGLRQWLGVVHIDIDDRGRRAAALPARRALALGGLLSLTGLSGLAMMLHLTRLAHELPLGDVLPLNALSQQLASLGALFALADAAPFLRGDGWHLLGMWSRLPHSGARSRSFILKRMVRNIREGRPLGARERIYLGLATASLAHIVVSATVLLGFTVPGALDAVVHLGNDSDHGHILGLVVGSLGILMAGAAWLVLLYVALGSLLQLRSPPSVTGGKVTGPITDPDELLIERCRRVPFLAKVDEAVLRKLLARMTREEVPADRDIVRQGEPGRFFYLIEDGQAEVLVEEESGLQHHAAKLGPGDFFGEVALLTDSPRTATVRALTPVKLARLDPDGLQKAVEAAGVDPEAVTAQLRDAAFLRNLPWLISLPTAAAATLQNALQRRDIKQGDVIVEQGTEADGVYLLRSGRAEVLHARDGTEREVASLDEGACIGEIATLLGGTRRASVRAAEDGTVLFVPASAFRDALATDLTAMLAVEQLIAERLAALPEGG